MSHGPVQYFVFAFPGNKFSGAIVPALADVVSKGLINIVDIAFIKKDAAGNIITLEINDLDDETFNAYEKLVDHTEGLLSDSDLADFAAQLPPNNSAALLVFEHAWASQLASAIFKADGHVLAQGFVPREIVEQVLQARAAA